LFFFSSIDEVDRIILDKPHHYHEYLLDVMKFIPSNIELMNKKYSSNKRQTTIVKDAIDDNNHEFIKSSKSINKREPINEMDLEKEVYRLQNYLKKMNEDFALQQRRLEDDCCEQLKILNENVDKTHRLQQDLEQGNSIDIRKLSLKILFFFQNMRHYQRNMNQLNMKMIYLMNNI
jgi:transcription initiation factor IIF auxiliary subunit